MTFSFPFFSSLRSRRRFGGLLAPVGLLCAALVLSGCASRGNDDFQLENARPAAEIYNEGFAYVQAGRYREAIDSFAELDQFYPYSTDARKGMVLTVFSAYQSGNFQLAIDTAERFLLLFPSHEDADYVLFLLGEAYLRTVPDVTRDQESARKAMEANLELIERFPSSEYVAQAQLNVIAIRDQLAGQEMLVGRYYQERREYAAAVNRFRLVVEDYQDTRHVEEALFRLTETYLAMGLTSEAQTAAAILGFNFPASEWYERAYALLGGSGLEPNENRGSWLSGLFNRGG